MEPQYLDVSQKFDDEGIGSVVSVGTCLGFCDPLLSMVYCFGRLTASPFRGLRREVEIEFMSIVLRREVTVSHEQKLFSCMCVFRASTDPTDFCSSLLFVVESSFRASSSRVIIYLCHVIVTIVLVNNFSLVVCLASIELQMKTHTNAQYALTHAQTLVLSCDNSVDKRYILRWNWHIFNLRCAHFGGITFLASSPRSSSIRR